jgi:hypothetical protein
MTKQVVITFLDGSKDWIDPIEDENRDIVYTRTLLTINNGYNDYEYDLSLIKDVKIEDI